MDQGDYNAVLFSLIPTPALDTLAIKGKAKIRWRAERLYLSVDFLKNGAQGETLCDDDTRSYCTSPEWT